MKRGQWIAVLAVVSLVVAACSDRGADPSASGGDSGGGGGATATSATPSGVATFGDIESPCDDTPAEVSEGVGQTDATGGPGEEQGITDDSIAIGTIADPGFSARPGLNQEILDAGEAFVQWCNDQGGINGRELDLTQYDAKYTEYQQRLGEACQQEFAIVGDGAVQDNLWLDVGAACGLVDIAGFSVTPEKSGVAGHSEIERLRVVQPLPNTSDRFAVGAMRLVSEDNPGAIDHIGMVSGNFATLEVQAAKTEEAYDAIGGTVVSRQTYNVAGEANWAPIAAGLEDDGVEWLNFVGEGANLALLQQAMSELDYSPEVTFQETNFYDQAYLDAAGDAAEGTYIRSVFVPFEEADQNPATQDYVDMVDAVGGKVALLGAQSVSAWLLFAQSAKACDDRGDLTRTCLLDTAGSVTDWTGGGLHAPTDPSRNTASACTLVLRVQDGAFTRYAPDDGFVCDDADLIELHGDYAAGG